MLAGVLAEPHAKESVEDLVRAVVKTVVRGTVRELAKEHARLDAKILQSVIRHLEVAAMAVAALMEEVMVEEQPGALDVLLPARQVVVVPVLVVVLVSVGLRVEVLVEQAV